MRLQAVDRPRSRSRALQKRTESLSDVGEFGLIDRIRKRATSGRRGAVRIGIGDDAAVVRPGALSELLATTDLLLEGIHFDLSYTDFYSLGWKSAAVNLSDIAAMGGEPRFCLTALGISSGVKPEQVLDFYRGVNDLLGMHHAELIGGDTCASRTDLFISVTVIGEVKRGRAVLRSGARPGDLIFVTGTLGDAAAGLELLSRGVRQTSKGRQIPQRKPSRHEAYLLKRHLRPEPRVSEGMALSRSGCASSMIDISDGLSSDLLHICKQSGVGAEVREGAIPLSPALIRMQEHLTRPGLTHALSGGEDYELLFTVPPSRLVKLRSLALPVTQIGMVRKGRSLVLIGQDEKKRTCGPCGFDHFSRVSAAERA